MGKIILINMYRYKALKAAFEKSLKDLDSAPKNADNNYLTGECIGVIDGLDRMLMSSIKISEEDIEKQIDMIYPDRISNPDSNIRSKGFNDAVIFLLNQINQ